MYVFQLNPQSRFVDKGGIYLNWLIHFTSWIEHIIGLRAGADGTQEEVNTLDTTAVKDPDVLARLKELGRSCVT